jgi:hypothetical protein
VCYRFLAGRNQILTEALLGGARVLEESRLRAGRWRRQNTQW